MEEKSAKQVQDIDSGSRPDPGIEAAAGSRGADGRHFRASVISSAAKSFGKGVTTRKSILVDLSGDTPCQFNTYHGLASLGNVPFSNN